MSTSPPSVRPSHLWTTRQAALKRNIVLPALLLGLSGCFTISDDEYDWRLSNGEADLDGESAEENGACEGGGEEQVFYTDGDGDGFGDPRGAVWDCVQPEGTATNSDDCDDTDPAAALLAEWWRDGDGDGSGGEVSLIDCQAPSGYANTTGDCDDARSSVFPGAAEICDGLDNDCNGLADDEDPDVDLSENPTYFRDADADGYGDPNNRIIACEIPDGYVIQDGDCNDDEVRANPGLVEICDDGIDNDCDGGPGDCVLPAEVDLGLSDVTLTSTLISASHGAQVLSTGDISGDGVGDLALSAPSEAPAGAVHLVDQVSELSGSTDTALVGMARLVPSESGGRLGHAMARVGDLDGDGLQDLLIGDPYDTTAGSSAGAAWLVGGPVSGDTAIASVGVALWGTSANAFAGWSLSSAGDVDSDGEVDLLVGAYRDSSVASQAGRAFLVRGPVTADQSLSDADWVVSGGWQDRVGYSIAGGADLNGDGVPDIVVGSERRDSDGLSNAGAVAVFYGPVSGSAVFSDADALRTGASASAFLGYAVATGGDLDGDGLHDLAMGAPGEGTGAVGGAGAVFVELGALSGTSDVASADARVSGAGSSDTVGTALRIVADIDGNGDDELFIGAPGTIGASGLDDGAALLWTSLPSGVLDTSSADVTLLGEANSRAGAAVDGGADLDGDGLPDFIVGAPSASRSHVILGRGL